MASFEVQIPAKRRLDVEDALDTDYGIEAKVQPAREGRLVLNVVGEQRSTKTAVEEVLAKFGGKIIEN